MELSLFLAKVFGLYFLIISIAMVVRREKFEKMMDAFAVDYGSNFLGIILGIIIGLLIVVSHNVWIKSWPVLITLIGWITLIKSSMYLFFPNTLPVVIRFAEKRPVYLTATIICFLLGLFLVCRGFYS
jgi:hypothetical protein